MPSAVCSSVPHIAAPASTIWATRASQFHSSHLALAGHIFLNHQLFEPQLLFQVVLVWCLPKWRELAQPPFHLIYRKEEINFSTKFGTITVSILIDSRRFEVSQGTTRRGNLNIRLKKIENISTILRQPTTWAWLLCFSNHYKYYDVCTPPLLIRREYSVWMWMTLQIVTVLHS